MKNWKNPFFALLLVWAMLLTSCAGAMASNGEWMDAKEWTDDLTMSLDAYNDAMGPTYASAYYGLYTKDCVIGEAGTDLRQYGFYTPQTYISADSCVYVVAPNGYTAEEFANTSAWIRVGYDYGVTVAFLAPEGGEWDLDNLDDELAYVIAVATDLSARTIVNYNESSLYIIGYGEGSTVANYAAMNLPNFFAGAAMMGTPAASPEMIEMVGNRNLYASALMGNFITPLEGFYNKDVPMPVWIVNDSAANEALEAYWKAANDVVDEGLRNDYAKIFNQNPLSLKQSAPYEALSHVWIGEKENAATNHDYEWTSYIWSGFLSKLLRLRAQERGTLYVNSAARRDALTYYEEEVDGLKRYWGVYTPASYDGSEAVPMVLFTHGHAHGAQAFFVNTGLWRVAEKYGFIILYGVGRPCSNHPLIDCLRWTSSGEGMEEELAYIEMILDRTEEQYKIDSSRIYNIGHSNGSGQAYTIFESMPERFAAFAPIGSTNRLYSSLEELPELQEDSVKYGLLSIFGGLEGGATLTEGSPIDISLKRALIANGLPADTAPVQYYNGKYTNTTYYNEEHIPLVKHMALDDTIHTVLPEFCEIAWDYMSAFSRGEDGALYYNGVAVQ